MTTNKIFNFSPSEFTFGFENCQKCYYDKKVHGIEIRLPFPSIFSKLDSLQKNYYHEKSSKLISQNLEEGQIVANYNKMLYSEILYDNKKRPFTMTGKIDGYIKHKNSFTVIDFKTTAISEKKIDTYASQLQSYALMMQKPRSGSLKLDPIKKLGIFCFDPSSISSANEKDCNIYIISVPTPVDENNVPNLNILFSATEVSSSFKCLTN